MRKIEILVTDRRGIFGPLSTKFQEAVEKKIGDKVSVLRAYTDEDINIHLEHLGKRQKVVEVSNDEVIIAGETFKYRKVVYEEKEEELTTI